MTDLALPTNRRMGSRVYDALWRRQLQRYPSTGPRWGYLGIVVLTTIMLYYLYYVEGAVTPLMLPYYHMSFQYFLYLLVVSNAIGAFTAFIGGLSDKIGRANLTIYGTLVVALVQLVGVPHIHSRFGFALAYCVIGFVEGIILVSTPALMRDFSPQMGRGAAMGFWALGPTMGSLAASLVATHTLTHLHPWQDQFIISGLVCMGVVVISFCFLRELSPQLRDQLMVSERERALVEARALGIDVEKATAHPLRSMLRLDLISSSVAVSLLLLFYFASVSVLTLYWVVVFGRSTADANGINVWYAAFLSATLVFFGIMSDRLRVRKPFMLVGAAATVVMTWFLIDQVGHPHTGYYSNVLVVVLLAAAIGCAYAPWMANYTEQVESHNPALSASGLAVWGWILRLVVAVSFLVLPRVITTSTTLVDNQGAATTLQAIQAAVPYAPSTTACASQGAPAGVIAGLETTHEPGPQTLANVIVACDRSHNLLQAVAAAGGLSNPQVQGLLAYNPLAVAIDKGRPVSNSEIAAKVGVHSQNLAGLLLAEKKLVPAQNASPKEWKRWWWVCLGGEVVFGLLVFTMRGRWSPRAAKRDFDEHERVVAAELATLIPRAEGHPSVGDGPRAPAPLAVSGPPEARAPVPPGGGYPQ
ncbi:MAG TPA: MFS transporter [Acidimicrobiales bacterium]|nr:MFS transporter [Acidimicrobiales bacterium]